MDIYDFINEKLTESGHTKKWLCEQIDLPYNSLQTLFSRRSKTISFEIVAKIALILNISLVEISKTILDSEWYSKIYKSHQTIASSDLSSIVFDSLDDERKMIAFKYLVSLLKEQQTKK